MRVAILSFLFAFTVSGQSGHWEIVRSFDSPGTEPQGLGWDGAFLWHTDGMLLGAGPLTQLDTASGNVLQTVYTLKDGLRCIVFINHDLWVVENHMESLLKIDQTTGTVRDQINVNSVIPISPPPSLGAWYLAGLGYDGQYLWFNAAGGYFFQLDIATRKIIHWYKATLSGEPDGLTFMWGHLFVVSMDSKIWELDPCTGAVIDWFTPPAGVGEDPEGLVWDGEDGLWYADNTNNKIYKIRLVDDFLTKPRAVSKTKLNCGSPAENGDASVGLRALACRLQPNPLHTGEALSIHLNGPKVLPSRLTFRVYDVKGALQRTRQAENIGHGPTGEFRLTEALSKGTAPGYYFVQFSVDGKSYSSKVLCL